MGSLYKLITKTNITAPYIVFPLVMPLILILFFSTYITGTVDVAQAQVNGIIVTVLAMSTMQSGIMGFGYNFLNIKKSILLKRAGATRLTKGDVLGAVALYGITMWAIQTVWTILIAQIFSMSGLFVTSDPTLGVQSVQIQWNAVHWASAAVACITGIFVSYALGLFFVSVSKNEQMFSGIVGFYFFAASLLGGVAVAGEGARWMQIIGYIIPNSYNAQLFDLAGGSAVLWTAPTPDPLSTIYVISKTDLILDIAMPILFGIVFIILANKTLKFD